MALIDQSKLDTANTSVHVKFNDLFTTGSPLGAADLFVERISTDSLKNELAFAAPTGSWELWDGSKTMQSLKAFKQSVVCKPRHYSIEIDRKDLAYDNSGIVGRHIGAQMTKASADYVQLIINEMVSNSGAGPLSYDGVNWLHTSHPMADGSVQSNKSTTAFSYANYDAGQQAISSFVGHDGQPLGLFADTIVCGPKMRKTALDIATNGARPVAVSSANAYADQGGTLTPVAATSIGNVFQGEVRVIVCDRLVGAYDDYVYLMCTSKPDKPFLHLEARAPELVTQFDMDSERRFNLDKFAWSVEADCQSACGFPLLTYGFIL